MNNIEGKKGEKEEEEIKEPNELQKIITEAFNVFDHGGDLAVPSTEIGTIIRSLGCCPTEAELEEIISVIRMEDKPDMCPLRTFLPAMESMLIQKRLKPASGETLHAAFLALDPEYRGYVTKEDLSKAMLEEGEPFTEEELKDMLSVAVDQDTGRIPYEYYINQLTIKNHHYQ